MNEPGGPSPDASQGSPPSTVREYVEANISRYTPDALLRAAVAAGYPEAEVKAAIDAAASRRTRPDLGRARWLIVGIYFLTYVVLAAGILIDPRLQPYGGAVIAFAVLSVAMGLALLVSLWLMSRATTVAGVVVGPLVLIALVGGACYATTGSPLGALGA